MTDDRRQPRGPRRRDQRSTWYRSLTGSDDAMTSTRSQARGALPNVLSNETTPNTLSGVGPPRRAARRGLTLRAVAGAVVVAIVAAVLVVLAR